jgi:hypothetical protein
MEYTYYHDAENKIVYRLPMTPDVSEVREKHNFVGWLVRLEISVVRADNKLVNGRWTEPWSEFPQQEFSSRYTKELAVSYFYNRQTPKCELIDQTLYDRLAEEYKKISEQS